MQKNNEILEFGSSSQGIVDGRPEGRQPPSAPIKLDTYVDKDASATDPVLTRASDTLTGATSSDLYETIGKPGSGHTSQELHHDGMSSRKRQSQGVDQFGPPGGAQSTREFQQDRGTKIRDDILTDT